MGMGQSSENFEGARMTSYRDRERERARRDDLLGRFLILCKVRCMWTEELGKDEGGADLWAVHLSLANVPSRRFRKGSFGSA